MSRHKRELMANHTECQQHKQDSNHSLPNRSSSYQDQAELGSLQEHHEGGTKIIFKSLPIFISLFQFK